MRAAPTIPPGPPGAAPDTVKPPVIAGRGRIAALADTPRRRNHRPMQRSRRAPRLPALAALVVLAGPAAAQDQAALERHVTEVAYRGCTLSILRVVHRGPLPGTEGPVVVATYDIEGCAGGNNSAQRLGVFRDTGGSIDLIRPPLPEPVSVDTARVEGGRIIIEGQRWSREDARCCPSIPVTLAFRLRDGVLVTDPAPQ